jgi:hypothetical protein
LENFETKFISIENNSKLIEEKRKNIYKEKLQNFVDGSVKENEVDSAESNYKSSRNKFEMLHVKAISVFGKNQKNWPKN